MTSIDLKKRDLRLLEIRLAKKKELRELMQTCWNKLDHDYADDLSTMQSLKSEIYLTQTKELRGSDNDKISN